jgi:hypothetical protein
MSVSLRDWLKNGWLVEHQTSPEEIRTLFELMDRDLVDCQHARLSSDWRFNIAYNAALLAATAALAASGYRATREAHHYRTIQSLAYTIGASKESINQFDRFRKKRSIGGYERVGAVSDMEVGEMFNLAQHVRKAVEQWLKTNHPGLLQGYKN